MTLELTFWLESLLGKEEKTMDIESWEFETTRVQGVVLKFGRTILKVTKIGGEEAELRFRGIRNLTFLDGHLTGVEGHFSREDLSEIEAFFGSEFPLTREGIKMLPPKSRRGSIRPGFIIT